MAKQPSLEALFALMDDTLAENDQIIVDGNVHIAEQDPLLVYDTRIRHNLALMLGKELPAVVLLDVEPTEEPYEEVAYQKKTAIHNFLSHQMFKPIKQGEGLFTNCNNYDTRIDSLGILSVRKSRIIVIHKQVVPDEIAAIELPSNNPFHQFIAVNTNASKDALRIRMPGHTVSKIFEWIKVAAAQDLL